MGENVYVRCLDGSLLPWNEGEKLPCIPSEYLSRPGETVHRNRVEISRTRWEVCVEDRHVGRVCMTITTCSNKKSAGIVDPFSGRLMCFLKPKIYVVQKKDWLFISVDPFPFDYIIFKLKTCGRKEEFEADSDTAVKFSGWAELRGYSPAGGLVYEREFWGPMVAVPAKPFSKMLSICGVYDGEPGAIYCELTGKMIYVKPGTKLKIITGCPELWLLRWNPYTGWYKDMLIEPHTTISST